MRKKIIISAALCGAGTTKEQTPYVPVTPEEISNDAIACAKAGATIIHIHARNERGANTMETERFAEIVDLIRDKAQKQNVDLILNLTTAGSSWSDEMRMAHLRRLTPEMCSYDPMSMNWANNHVFTNSPAFLEKLGLVTQELGIKPECEIFNGGDLGNVAYYVKKGVLRAPVHYQFVLGVPGGMPGDSATLSYLLPRIPEGSTWGITGIGKAHMPCMLLGLAEGCTCLRVGLEDNIYMEKGSFATNATLVDRAVKLAEVAGRSVATAAEAREILGVQRKW